MSNIQRTFYMNKLELFHRQNLHTAFIHSLFVYYMALCIVRRYTYITVRSQILDTCR